MTLNEAKTLSEIVKNVVQALAMFGAVWAIWLWVYKRKDRAADVLLMLETRFADSKVLAGRGEVEDQAAYNLLKPALSAAVAARKGGAALTQQQSAQLENVDALLRFYVVLLGIRRANQVPDHSLRTCYRFWLGLYYSKERAEFRAYVDEFFRTLSRWLEDDEKKPTRRRFFDPQMT